MTGAVITAAGGPSTRGAGDSTMTIEDRGQPRRTLRRGIGIERTAILAGLALASIANAQTPDYEGSVCVVGPDQVRFTLETDVEATNVLLYPDPPGGGWYMDRVEPGRFVREMTIQEAAEQSIRFSLIIQTPAQYAYPDHVVQTGSGCVEFERDDVMPPPPRGFEHALVHEGGTLRFEFEAFPHTG